MKPPVHTRCQATGCCNLIGSPGRHRPQKWCSRRCRQAQYSAPCVDCGRLLSGSDGRGPNAPQRCVACVGERASEAAGRAAVALEMWRLREVEGLLNVEIAARVGAANVTVTTELYRLRAVGFAVAKSPYRGSDRRGNGAKHADAQCATLLRELAKLGVHPPDVGLPWRGPAAERAAT